MRIVAVCMARNEAHTIGAIVEHLYTQGVDRVIVEDGHSTDTTWKVAEAAGAEVIGEPRRDRYQQGVHMTDLVALHAQPGDWVIPFDADEWWCPADTTRTLRDVLTGTAATRAAAPTWEHYDWEHRAVQAKHLVKVAFRYETGAQVADGAHNVIGVPGPEDWQLLQVREWQYRSWDHFLEKIDKARDLYAAAPLMDPQAGVHMRRLITLTDDELTAEWAQLRAGIWGGWTWDPIPAEPRIGP